MIKSVSSTNSRGERLDLDLRTSQETVGLTIISIEGLGSSKGMINTIGGPTYAGTNLNSKKVEQRNIVITLVNNFTGEDGSDVRELLYKYFSVTDEIIFGVVSDRRNANIAAVVETDPLRMFAKNENTEISLICPKPYFVDVEETLVQFSGTVSGFSFPFSNRSISANKINFGKELGYIERVVNYKGDVSTGISIKLHTIGPVSGTIHLYNVTYNKIFTIDLDAVEEISGPIEFGDDIYINTRVGQKSMILERGGITYDILNARGIFTDWLRLYPGLNALSYKVDSGSDNLELEIRYNALYEGIV